MPRSKLQIRLLKIAEEDFTEIVSYIAADNINAANTLANKIEKNLELLSDNPKLGRIPRDEEIRNLGYTPHIEWPLRACFHPLKWFVVCFHLQRPW